MVILHDESGCAGKDRKKMREEAEGKLLDPKKMKASPEIREEAKREFPEEMLEMVIAKMSFPALLKARVLSKSWLSKFVVNNPKSCEAWAFQSQVTANASPWAMYAPVFVSSSSNLMPVFQGSASELLAPLPPYICQIECRICLAGALVLVDGLGRGDGLPENTLHVRNLITGSCRYLTLPCGCGELGELGLLCLIAVGCRSYKVLAVFYLEIHGDYEGDLLCVVYDSLSNSWTCIPHEVTDNPTLDPLLKFFYHHAYMNGKVYTLAEFPSDLKLLSYDLENTAWTIVCEGFDPLIFYTDTSGLFSCGDKVIMVLFSGDEICNRDGTLEDWDYTIPLTTHNMDMYADAEDPVYFFREESIQIYQFDLQYLQLVLLSDGPPGNMGFLESSVSDWTKGNYRWLSADANFLYFGRNRLPNSVAKFNLNKREWSSIPNPLVNSTPDCSSERHLVD